MFFKEILLISLSLSFLAINTCFVIKPSTIVNNINNNANFMNHADKDISAITWYPIGFAKDFNKKQKQVTIRDTNYIVWKHKNNYYGMRDACSHQGASFVNGKIHSNKIMCPYHGYIFEGDTGKLVQIPKLKKLPCENSQIHSFKVVEKGEILYLNTVPLHSFDDNSGMQNNSIDETSIFVEPEFYEDSHKAIHLEKEFEHCAKIVTVNSLDICHIGFVHSFGNRQNPMPTNELVIEKINDWHYKTTYQYLPGKESIVNKVYNYKKIEVENEYVLPHTTVARVKFGKYSSTIITHALPVSKWKTKLFVKAYRNYMYFDLKDNLHNLPYFIKYLINVAGNKLTLHTMKETLNEDKAIIDLIDKQEYEGRFSIHYDLLSDHYKANYKKYYEFKR